MNNQLSVVTWQTVVKKSIVWGVCLFLLAVLQTSFFSVIRVFSAVPDLVLPAVVAIAVYDRERTGTIAGIIGGYFVDALGGVGLSLSPLVYMICGCLAALLVYSILRRDFFSWLVITAGALVISGIAALICVAVNVESAAFTASQAFSRLLVPQFFASLVAGIPVYFIIKLVWLRFFNNREMEG